MICEKCNNSHPGHDCSKYTDTLLVDSYELAYNLGLPTQTLILEAISWPCDGTCKWPIACSYHIELNCCYEGKEFYRRLTMDSAKTLMWKTRMRIFRVIPNGKTKVKEAKRRVKKKTGTPLFVDEGCPECGGQIFPSGGRCMTCPSCGWSACS